MEDSQAEFLSGFMDSVPAAERQYVTDSGVKMLAAPEGELIECGLKPNKPNSPSSPRRTKICCRYSVNSPGTTKALIWV